MDSRPLDEIVASVFLAIAAIVLVARLMAMVFRRFGQPAVVGEILAGLALGPSLLGALPGNPTDLLFPGDIRPYLSVIANLGLIIFMFIVGLELDVGLVRGKARAAATISVSSVVLPFGLGCGLAVWLYDRHREVDGDVVDLLPFALFIGASMSVTAFPVLARILSERGMHRTPTGALALACAAIDDILAWSLLAVVLAVISSEGLLDLPLILAESLAFVAFMFLVVRPRLRVLVGRHAAAGRLTPDIFAVVLVGVMVSSWVTHHIGIHSIFGAFLFGVVMPRVGAARMSQEILEKIEQVTVLLLLPVFFIATGLNVDVGSLGSTGLGELAAVLVVATVGKFVGAVAAARVVRVRPRRAAAIGVLMNTRGLTELVLLNIGLEAGVLDRQLFTILVLMAVVTTIVTEPLLRLVYPERMVLRERAEAERAALGAEAQYRVIAVVEGADDEPVVDAGVALLGREAHAELLISRFDPPARKVEVGAGLVAELAAVAESFEAVQRLVRRAADMGATTTASTRFSDDPVADLTAQAGALDADVLVLGRSEADLDRGLPSGVDCPVVVRLLSPAGLPAPADGGTPAWSRVVLVMGPGGDGLAAAEQAVRIAVRTGADLWVVDSADRRLRRRIATLVRSLAQAGVTARVVETPEEEGAGGTVVITGLGDRSGLPTFGGSGVPASVLLVRAAPDDQVERLERLLHRIPQQA